jgi:hypothetical protein
MSNPSIFTQLLNLSSAIIEQVGSGCPATDEETRKLRVEACAICPKLDKENYKCNECGCYLKYKIAWATQECPLGNWEK